MTSQDLLLHSNTGSYTLFDEMTTGRLRRVRVALTILVSSSMTLCGCMHFAPLEAEEETKTLQVSYSPIKVTLNDGSEITAAAYHYVQVLKPSNFVYVSGKRAFGGAVEEMDFIGKIQPVSAETLGTDAELAYRFSLGPGSSVTCRPADCIFVDSTGGAGLWLVGVKHEGRSSSAFRGKVEERAITAIEFYQANTTATTVVILGGAVVLIGIAALIAFANSWSDWGHGWY